MHRQHNSEVFYLETLLTVIVFFLSEDRQQTVLFLQYIMNLFVVVAVAVVVS